MPKSDDAYNHLLYRFWEFYKELYYAKKRIAELEGILKRRKPDAN